MDEIKTKKQEIGDLLWKLWNLFPEPKKTYTHYYQQVDLAIDNWHLSDREKRIAAREKGDARI